MQTARLEKFVVCELPVGQALLMRVPEQGFQRFTILLDTVGPEIITHQCTCLFQFLADPGQ